MKKILIFCLVALSAHSAAWAQTASEELTRLKEHLGVPAKTVIRSDSAALPKKNPLRVFIGTGLDTQVKANFTHWMERWNKSQSKKYGKMELTNTLSQADVVLARFVDRGATTTQYGGASSSRLHNQFDVGVVLGIPFPYPSHYPETVVPVYAYVLVNDGKQWAIAYRYVDTAKFRQSKRTGKYLWDQFQKMVKDGRK